MGGWLLVLLLVGLAAGPGTPPVAAPDSIHGLLPLLSASQLAPDDRGGRDSATLDDFVKRRASAGTPAMSAAAPLPAGAWLALALPPRQWLPRVAAARNDVLAAQLAPQLRDPGLRTPRAQAPPR